MKSMILKTIGAAAIALSLASYFAKPAYSDWYPTPSPHTYCWHDAYGKHCKHRHWEHHDYVTPPTYSTHPWHHDYDHNYDNSYEHHVHPHWDQD